MQLRLVGEEGLNLKFRLYGLVKHKFVFLMGMGQIWHLGLMRKRGQIQHLGLMWNKVKREFLAFVENWPKDNLGFKDRGV